MGTPPLRKAVNGKAPAAGRAVQARPPPAESPDFFEALAWPPPRAGPPAPPPPPHARAGRAGPRPRGRPEPHSHPTMPPLVFGDSAATFCCRVSFSSSGSRQLEGGDRVGVKSWLGEGPLGGWPVVRQLTGTDPIGRGAAA